MKQFWDERYAEPHFVYGEAPNVFFENSLKDLSAGKILLPCEGEGRQAVHAAAQGWEVLAFDQSSAGRDKALQLAEKIAGNAPLSNYAITQALPRIADLSASDGLFMESLISSIAQGDPAAKERVRAFLDQGPKAIEFFTSKTAVQFDMPLTFPDYHAEAPGGSTGGRSMVTTAI